MITAAISIHRIQPAFGRGIFIIHKFSSVAAKNHGRKIQTYLCLRGVTKKIRLRGARWLVCVYQLSPILSSSRYDL